MKPRLKESGSFRAISELNWSLRIGRLATRSEVLEFLWSHAGLSCRVIWLQRWRLAVEYLWCPFALELRAANCKRPTFYPDMGSDFAYIAYIYSRQKLRKHWDSCHSWSCCQRFVGQELSKTLPVQLFSFRWRHYRDYRREPFKEELESNGFRTLASLAAVWVSTQNLRISSELSAACSGHHT